MNIASASRFHQYLIVAVLASILAGLFLRELPGILLVVLLFLWMFTVICCYKLASALEKPPILWAVLGLVGFFLLWIPQLLLVNAANRIFKSQGLKIGFLGGATRPL